MLLAPKNLGKLEFEFDLPKGKIEVQLGHSFKALIKP